MDLPIFPLCQASYGFKRCAFAVIIVGSSIAAIDANIIADAVAIDSTFFLFIIIE